MRPLTKHLVVLGAVLLASLLFFGFNAGDFFVSDDFDWLRLTADTQTPLWQTFVGNYYGEHGIGGSFRPLVNTVFSILYSVFHLSPYGYHIMSILLHAGVAFMIYLISLRLFERSKHKDMISTGAAIIFAVMPNHAEAVIWIAAIGDPMSTLFYLLAFYLYLKHQESKHSTVYCLLSTVYCLLSTLFFISALLSKEIALTLPFLILGYELIIRSNFNCKNLLKKTFLYFLIFLAFLVYRYWSIGLLFGYYSVESLGFDFFGYLQTLINLDVNALVYGEARIWLTNLLLSVWPLYLGAWVAVLIWGARNIVVNKHRKLTFLIYYWGLNVLLVLPLGMSMLHDEGERYGYISSVAIAILLAWLLALIWQSKKTVAILLSVCLFSYFAYNLIIKSQKWHQASHASEHIVSQLDQFDYSRYKKTYFVGMPEIYEGAQVMRNGIVQAAELYVNEQDSMERIPVYLTLNYQNVFDSYYTSIESLPDGVHMTADSFIVSGDAAKTYPEYKWELWNYDYDRGLSDTIRVQFMGGREFDWARNELQIIYYTDGMLESIDNAEN